MRSFVLIEVSFSSEFSFSFLLFLLATNFKTSLRVSTHFSYMINCSALFTKKLLFERDVIFTLKPSTDNKA